MFGRHPCQDANDKTYLVSTLCTSIHSVSSRVLRHAFEDVSVFSVLAQQNAMLSWVGKVYIISFKELYVMVHVEPLNACLHAHVYTSTPGCLDHSSLKVNDCTNVLGKSSSLDTTYLRAI